MLLRERRRIEREAGEQKDLVADSLKREADLIHKNNSPGAAKEIGELYDRALRQYGGSITGFKRMAEDYFSFCKDDPETARKAARDIELAFEPQRHRLVVRAHARAQAFHQPQRFLRIAQCRRCSLGNARRRGRGRLALTQKPIRQRLQLLRRKF